MLIISLLSGCSSQAEVSDVLESDIDSQVSDTNEGTDDSVDTELPSNEDQVEESSDKEAPVEESVGQESSGDEEVKESDKVETESQVTTETTDEATVEETPDETETVEEVAVEMISLSINGPEEVGQFYTTSMPFIEGESAFEALVRAGDLDGLYIEYTGSGKGAYVQGIEDYFEFDHGPVSGWLYSVNNEFPQVGTGRFELSPSDQLVFHYTKDGGDDVKK